jgi:hypothetical protein
LECFIGDWASHSCVAAAGGAETLIVLQRQLLGGRNAPLRLFPWSSLWNYDLLGGFEAGVKWGIDQDVRFVQNSLFPRMIFVSGVIVPKCVVMRADSLDASLNDVIATSKAGKFGNVNRGALQRSSTDAGRIGNCIVFSVTDYINFLNSVGQNLFVIVNTTRHAVKTC